MGPREQHFRHINMLHGSIRSISERDTTTNEFEDIFGYRAPVSKVWYPDRNPMVRVCITRRVRIKTFDIVETIELEDAPPVPPMEVIGGH